MQTTLICHSTTVFPGRLAAKPKTDPSMAAAGLTRLGYGPRIRLRLGERTVILSQARLVTRPSGRKRHLSRYLVGLEALTGRVFEVFLETIDGVRNACFEAKEALQRVALRLVAHGLNLRQVAGILGAR